jgi:hypothetical protein
MKSITHSHVPVDSLTYPWLIHRFVDIETEFQFVPIQSGEKDSRCNWGDFRGNPAKQSQCADCEYSNRRSV